MTIVAKPGSKAYVLVASDVRRDDRAQAARPFKKLHGVVQAAMHRVSSIGRAGECVHHRSADDSGVVAGAQIPYTSRWISKALKVDDPCDVGPVHAIPGLLGGIATGFWAPMIPNGFHGYTVHFWPQVLATVAALAYSLIAGSAIFAFS